MAPDPDKLNQRLRRHWTWLALLAVVALLLLGNLTRSFVADTGGLTHIRKVGVLDAMAYTMTNKLVAGVQGKAPPVKEVQADITSSVVQFLVLVIVFAAMHGRVNAIERLRALREELELRPSGPPA